MDNGRCLSLTVLLTLRAKLWIKPTSSLLRAVQDWPFVDFFCITVLVRIDFPANSGIIILSISRGYRHSTGRDLALVKISTFFRAVLSGTWGSIHHNLVHVFHQKWPIRWIFIYCEGMMLREGLYGRGMIDPQNCLVYFILTHVIWPIDALVGARISAARYRYNVF